MSSMKNNEIAIVSSKKKKAVPAGRQGESPIMLNPAELVQ